MFRRCRFDQFYDSSLKQPRAQRNMRVKFVIHGGVMSTSEQIKKVGELIKDIRIAMMTTVGPNGQLHSRPMAMQNHEFDGTLWFFTSDKSGKINSIENDQHVNLSFVQDRKFISVAGRAELVKDRAKMEEFYNPLVKTWFPEGLEDPEIALLKVTVDSVEYWDTPNSVVVHVYGLAKAILTGERPDPGDHQRVDLKH